MFILGNIDPYGVMVKGKPDDVEDAVKNATIMVLMLYGQGAIFSPPIAPKI
jgi:hypothetical protein